MSLQFGDMSEFRAVSITESSRNLVCSCLRYFLCRSVDFGFAWNLFLPLWRALSLEALIVSVKRDVFKTKIKRPKTCNQEHSILIVFFKLKLNEVN